MSSVVVSEIEKAMQYGHVPQIPIVTVTPRDGIQAAGERSVLKEERYGDGNAEVITSFDKSGTYYRSTYAQNLAATDRNDESFRSMDVGWARIDKPDEMKGFSLKSTISPRSKLSLVSSSCNDFVGTASSLLDTAVGLSNSNQRISPAVFGEAEYDRSDDREVSSKLPKILESSFKTARKIKEAAHLHKLGVGAESPENNAREGNKKERKGKLKKSKRNTRKRLSKMTKKFSERQVLSPSYKQKNEDFHKFFKDLPGTERLLVDYACALVKDILVQGRMYVSQNYLCFHSTILKWQTVVTVNLVDIDQMTKEKTVKVIPNAIQVLLKDKTKITFTSFTARDRAYIAVFRLWQNALLDKPMSATELWRQIHQTYGEELGGCSSEDDYVKPNRMITKHSPIAGDDGELAYEFGTTNKIKRSPSTSHVTNESDFDRSDRSSKSKKSSRESPIKEEEDVSLFDDDKSSHISRDSVDDLMLGEETAEPVLQSLASPVFQEDANGIEEADVKDKELDRSDDESADFAMPNLPKHSFTRNYETSAKDMHRIIFSDECSFWRDTLISKGTTGISFGTWKSNDSSPGESIRELSYTLRLDNSFGPKTSFVKETQIYYPSSIEGKSYVVDCIAQNYGIPYADYFYTAMRYCIRKVSKGSCELRITWELRYKKSPWGLVKNFIEKNVASGMAENFNKLQRQLHDRIDRERSERQPTGVKATAKSNVRRRKRKSVSNASQDKAKSSSEPCRREDSTDSVQRVEIDGQRASPSVVAGIPSVCTSNGFIPNDMNRLNGAPKLHYFGRGAKFLSGAMLFLIILLLYNNYNMNQRLNTLEQVTTAAAAADGVNPAVTAALLDRPGVPITSNPEMLSSYLQAIDKRLRRLEETVLKFTEESKNKWEKVEKRWESTEALVKKVLKFNPPREP